MLCDPPRLSSRAQVEGSRCASLKVTSSGSLRFGRDDGVEDLRSAHFQLPPQNPVQQPEQCERRSDQHDSVENEDVDLHSQVPLFLTKKYVRASPTAIVTLFHLRIRNQVGNFLIQIQRLACHGTIRFRELIPIERMLPIENLVDQSQIT